MSLIGAFFLAIVIFIFLALIKLLKFMWIIFFILIFVLIRKKLKRNRERKSFHEERNSYNDNSSFKNSWSNHFSGNKNNKRWNDNNNNYQEEKSEIKIDREKQIILLAIRFKGKLTISDIVINSKLSSIEAEKLMKLFVDNFVVETKMSDNGVVVYNFPKLVVKNTDTINIAYNNIKEFEKVIFKLALKNEKQLSLASIILKTSLTMKDVLRYMKDLCNRGIASKTQTVHDAIVYDFPGILSEDEKDNAKGMWE